MALVLDVKCDDNSVPKLENLTVLDRVPMIAVAKVSRIQLSWC